MASAENRKKKAINILDLPGNNEAVKYRWQFVLETSFSCIEKDLAKNRIELLQTESDKQTFIATCTLDDSKMAAIIFEVMNNQSSKIEAIKMSPQNKASSVCKKGVKQFIDQATGNVWMVGPNDLVKSVHEKPELTQGDNWNENSNATDESWENLQRLKQLELTEEEQAKVCLFGLLDSKILKNRFVDQLESEFFKVSLSYENKTENDNIESYIRKELQKCKINHDNFEMSPSELAFMQTIKTHKIINEKLNGHVIKYVWYISNHSVNIYCKHERMVRNGIMKIKDLVKTCSFKVSPRYSSSTEAQQMMTQLKREYEGFVSILHTDCKSEIHFITTENKFREFENALLKLFPSKWLDIPSDKRIYYENCISKLKPSIEEQYCVDIFEEELNDSLKCLVLGGKSSMQNAYSRLRELVDQITTKIRYYFVSGEIQMIESTIGTIGNEDCIVMDQVKRKRGNEVDLRNEAFCCSWTLPNGNDIKLINGDSDWIQKDNIVLLVSEFTAEKKNHEFSLKEEQPHVTLYLPKWKEGSNNEKERMTESLDELFNEKDLYKKKFPLVVCTEEPMKLSWPPTKFTKQFLLSLERNKVSASVIVLEPSLKSYTTLIDVFQKYAYYIRDQRIVNVAVETGVLANQKCDVIVNSTSRDMQLAQGAVSSSILHAAGDSLQQECNVVMQKRNDRLLHADEIVCTGGYNLPCKYVFHGALSQYWSKQKFKLFVSSCLLKADGLQLSSMAFPPIGTGKLKYPVKEVAETMLDVVQGHKNVFNNSSLDKVVFVIYDKDKHTFEIFQKELEKRMQGFERKETKEKCPNYTIIKVSLTALKNDVDESFDEFESVLKTKLEVQKEIKRAPQPQEMARTVDDDVDFTSEWPKSNQKAEYTGNEDGKKSDSDVLFMRSTEFNHESIVGIELVGSYSKSPLEMLKILLRKHNVEESLLLWCHYVPKVAKLKFSTEKDADIFLQKARNETNFKATKHGPEAVINIRAKTDKSLERYFGNTNNVFELEKESGVKVSRNTDSIFLLGSLSEITTARIILMAWKTEENRLLSYSANNNVSTQSKSTDVPHLQEKPKKYDLTYSEQHSNKASDVSEFGGQVSEKSLNDDDKYFPDGTERDVFVEVNGNLRVCCKPKSESRTVSYSNRKSKDVDYGHCLWADDMKFTERPKNEGVFVGKTNTTMTNFTNVTTGDLVFLKDGLSVFVYQGDLCYLNVDCIVNSSDEKMRHKSGLASVITLLAGENMKKECKNFIRTSKALNQYSTCVTTAGNLSHYRCIIHSCSPVWQDQFDRENFSTGLQKVIVLALQEAHKRGFKSVAIPAIGSGKRGAPKEICFSAYIEGVLSFSQHLNKKELFDVHFVDKAQSVVEKITAAFLANIPISEQNEKIKEKITKLPRRLKERFQSFVGGNEKEIKAQLFHLHNEITLIICDGALLSAQKHKHLQNCDTYVKPGKSAVVITENPTFEGDSRSSLVCLKRGGRVFLRKYDELRQNQKNVGDVIIIKGDESIKFDILMYAILPSFSKEATVRESKAQQDLFQTTRTSLQEILKSADHEKVYHLVVPILGEDLYDLGSSWFLEICVSDMIDCIRSFADARTSSHPLVIHVPTNKNEKLKQLISANFVRRTRDN